MVSPFLLEAWIEYGIGLLVLLSRLGYRMHTIGPNLQGDDYLSAAAILLWTGELCMLHLIGQYGSITGMTDEIALDLTEEAKQRIVLGSKCLLAGWCIYVTLIWCLKGCMLFLMSRLTLNLNQKRQVMFAAGACVAAYIATLVVILVRCLPIYRNWQIYPYPGDACALHIPSYLALVVTNITTDMMLLMIPLPLIWRVQMPIWKKLVCALWLCSGVFIITATLLRCILCLQSVDNINLGTIWSIRETFIGIIAVNAPVLGPWIVKKATVAASKGSKGHSHTSHADSKNGDIVTIGQQSNRLDRLNKEGRGWTNLDTESEEVILQSKATD